jgi:hypothetical protein
MKTNNIFYCPHCFGYLSINDKIIFKVKSQSNEFGLLMLSSEIGDYDSVVASGSIKKVENELYEFYCPLCSACLNVESSDMRLVKLFMKDSKSDKYEIYFSGIYGEHCTYVIKDYSLKYFGPHSKRYMEEIEKYKEFYDRHL